MAIKVFPNNRANERQRQHRRDLVAAHRKIDELEARLKKVNASLNNQQQLTPTKLSSQMPEVDRKVLKDMTALKNALAEVVSKLPSNIANKISKSTRKYLGVD